MQVVRDYKILNRNKYNKLVFMTSQYAQGINYAIQNLMRYDFNSMTWRLWIQI